MALDPRIRKSAGQFSAKGELTARVLRKAWTVRTGRPLVAPKPVAFDVPGILLEFDAVPSTFTADKIDDVNAVIRCVSVITSGLIARGHDLEVDGVTLAQMQKCAESKGQVPVKVDHKSGAAAVCGFLTNFRQEDNKLKADWFLLESHPQKAQILEVARRMPKGVGLSASFVAPDKPERTAAGKSAARCTELISVDYVTLPAANPDGMFAARVDTPTSPMNPELLAAIKAAIAEAVAPLTEQIKALQDANVEQDGPTLEEVAGMNEAQLAELGLTPADVQAALEAVAAQEGTEGETAPEGELVAAGATTETAAPAATAGDAGATGLAAIQKQVVELSNELKAIKGQKVVDAEAKLVGDIETHFAALVEENERLTKALEAGGKPVTPSVETGAVKFFAAGEPDEFENLVELAIKDQKVTKGVAFAAVIKENPAAYRAYLGRRGLIKL